MNSKNHRLNHDFQIVNFLAGSCHTPDGVYSLLCDQREDREVAIKTYEASQLKRKLKMMDIEKRMKSWFQKTRLGAYADLAEIQATEAQEEACYLAAIDELKFIQKCIDAVQPHRKFSHLPDRVANEMAQHDEWKYELIYRAENFILLTGSIPPDHFATMRQHPDFSKEILPAIQEIKRLARTDEKLLLDKIQQKTFELPKLLELNHA